MSAELRGTPYVKLGPAEKRALEADFARVVGRALKVDEVSDLARAADARQVLMVVRRPVVPRKELAAPLRAGAFDPAVHTWSVVDNLTRQTSSFEPVEEALALRADADGPHAEMLRRDDLMAAHVKWQKESQERFEAEQRKKNAEREEAEKQRQALRPKDWEALPRDVQALLAASMAIEDGVAPAVALRQVAMSLRHSIDRIALPSRRWW